MRSVLALSPARTVFPRARKPSGSQLIHAVRRVQDSFRQPVGSNSTIPLCPIGADVDVVQGLWLRTPRERPDKLSGGRAHPQREQWGGLLFGGLTCENPFGDGSDALAVAAVMLSRWVSADRRGASRPQRQRADPVRQSGSGNFPSSPRRSAAGSGQLVRVSTMRWTPRTDGGFAVAQRDALVRRRDPGAT